MQVIILEENTKNKLLFAIADVLKEHAGKKFTFSYSHHEYPDAGGTSVTASYSVLIAIE